jgi:predicted enzyme related to lactoylglutathione lyase
MGSPCWVDLMSADTDRARAFYGALLGWECEDANPDFGGYANFTKDGERVAGLMGKTEESLPDLWSVYLEVADAEATIAAVEARGLPVFVPAMPVGDLGVMGVMGDPGGAMIGLWQPGQHRGFTNWMEPGTPGWFELYTRDLDASLAFYREVFGWETRMESDTPEFRYATQVQGELQYAGAMDITTALPAEVPAHWSVYFDVADIDASCAQVVELGGSVMMPPEETPYGRLAMLTDPMGAGFKLHQ